MTWEYAGYTFNIEDEPTARTGAGEWNKMRKVVTSKPINSNVDVLTDFGFSSARRTIMGQCTQAFRDQMRSFFNVLTVGNLVDNEAQSQSAQILEMEFKERVPSKLYSYTLTFIAR